jgi:SOS-response transcriptional repressor LexA
LIAKYEAGAIKNDREGLDQHTIPCIVPHGEIRKGIIYDLCETVEIKTSIKKAFIAVEMTDNDLAPVYCKGDIILFEDRFPESGEVAAFFNADRAYIRKFIEENGQYRLKSLFPQGEDIILKRMDCSKYIGTCVGVIRL